MPEIHLGKDVVQWLAATNLFVAKMGFLPIGAVLEAQLSVLVCAPSGAWKNGYRFEIVDVRMQRMIQRDAPQYHYRTYREYEPRFTDAERAVNGGMEMIHHVPIRSMRAAFNDSIELDGMNSRVKLRINAGTWMSHNVLDDEEEEITIVQCYNWWWGLEELAGFSPEELTIIRNLNLLTKLNANFDQREKRHELAECWGKEVFRYNP